MATKPHPNRIFALRKAQNLTQNTLAELAGCTAQQIHRLETGHRKLSEEWMRKLAPHLGVAPGDLLAEAAHPNPIRDLREARRMSQGQLAAAVGTTQAQIGKLERSERRLAADWLRRLAGPLGVEPADLLPGARAPSRPPGPTAGYSAAFVQRLRRAVDHNGGLAAAAAAADCTPASLRNMTNGVEPAPFTTVARLARAANVSLDWLATGGGPAFAPQPLFQDHAGRYRIGRRQVEILDEHTLLAAMHAMAPAEAKLGPFTATERHDHTIAVYHHLMELGVETIDVEDHLDAVVAFLRARLRPAN